jgi:hypothetical protein
VGTACLPGEDDEPALRTYNPLRGLPLPDREQVQRQIIETAAEAALFIRCAYEVDVNAAELIVTALASAMRWGELAGLPVRAVHPERGTVTIEQVLVREYHQWIVRARPKTKKGYRELPILDPVIGHAGAAVPKPGSKQLRVHRPGRQRLAVLPVLRRALGEDQMSP